MEVRGFRADGEVGGSGPKPAPFRISDLGSRAWGFRFRTVLQVRGNRPNVGISMNLCFGFRVLGFGDLGNVGFTFCGLRTVTGIAGREEGWTQAK